ncbi:WXG100 family type VII secretion target [Streptomyces sp. NPDC059452]|uniref:WXG100 family type VII secretion target n=1 Tax=Streptomyces sp. NPDC059452 TaxID=3346835 RepID=UPI003698DC02
MPANDGTTVVTYSSLELAASAIEAQAKRLDQDLTEIKGMIESVSELWEGEAKSAYRAAQKRWDADATAIKQNLFQISSAVREAGVAYRSGDKRAAANFL